MSCEKKLSEMFYELVPIEGKADTVAGEIVRAINRIAYRFINDGDQLGIGYGCETCNPAAHYLEAYGNQDISLQLKGMYNLYFQEDIYKVKLHKLCSLIVDYLEECPELKQIKNEEDMNSYYNPYVDYDEDEEDEY